MAGLTLDRKGLSVALNAASTTRQPRAPLNFLGLACAIGVSTIYLNQPLLVDMGRTYGAPAGKGGWRGTRPAAGRGGGTTGGARVETEVAVDGEKVDGAVGDSTVPATVDVLSVYDPEKKKPRS